MNKKTFVALSIFTLLFSLCSCVEQDHNGEEPSPIDPAPSKPASDNILLTEINTGTSIRNRAVEISNIGDEDVSLDGYTLEIYREYSKVSDISISLSGYEIKSHDTFIVAYSSANEEILEKANLVTDDYLENGTFPISLNYYGTIIDTIGTIGYIYDFAEKAVLVKLKEYFKQEPEFDENHWIRYPINTIDTLGNYDVVAEDTLLNGPKLNNEAFNKPFCEDGKGKGGVIEVSLSWTSDGDTTGFNYGNQYSSEGVSGSLSTRYYGINTPEIAHSAGEVSDPYGDEAKYFTNDLLRDAKRYIIQSVDGYSIHETYGRMLGYVWISDKNNPSVEDYQLLNFLIVKNGFSKPAFITRSAEYNSLMTYQGISYVEYLYKANQYAATNKLNIHSGD